MNISYLRFDYNIRLTIALFSNRHMIHDMESEWYMVR